MLKTIKDPSLNSRVAGQKNPAIWLNESILVYNLRTTIFQTCSSSRTLLYHENFHHSRFQAKIKFIFGSVWSYLHPKSKETKVHVRKAASAVPFFFHPPNLTSPLSLETCTPPLDTHHGEIPDSMMIQWNQGDWKQLI